jgi:hypothetical protein
MNLIWTVSQSPFYVVQWQDITFHWFKIQSKIIVNQS